MTAAERIVVASAIFVLLLFCARVSRAQTGVCYRSVTRTRVSYRSHLARYDSYRCGWAGLRRCRREVYGSQSFTESYVASQFDCCTGYTTCGPASDRCCQNTNCTTGDVRLVGGSSPLEGRVEVCYYNQWGTVCDDSWDTPDARVVCRQLGYSSSSASAYARARFGQGTGPIVMDEVRCTGSEVRLMDCPLRLSHNCGHHGDAGVQCTLTTYGCTSGDVRLAGSGSSSTRGRVELCHNNQWGTICDNNWGNSDAEVICKQLKYSSYGAQGESNAIFGRGSGSIWLSDVGCNGTEERLLDCPTGTLGGHTCSHSDDAGVTCNTTCTDGDLRLSGGRNGTEGRVEMCSRSEWGTICGDLWDDVNAQVVCNQLGFLNTGAVAVTSYIGGTGSILLDDVNCIGNESRLIDCSHNSLGVHDCTHADDAGVRCIRLPSDINECEENTHDCAQICTDTESGYVCSCRSGYHLVNDGHGCDVPEVPALTSVSRLSGTSAVISWTPLTQDEARRFLITALELAYEPVIDSALNCSTYNFTDSATILIWENLFEQSTANISGLEPHREYCIAIKVSTTGGESGFSSAIKLPLPRGAPFQIKLKLPDDLKCSNMVEADIKEEITQFIAQQIAQLCQCRYSSSFIVGGLILCTQKHNVVYQAKFLPSDSKTALEIRNITQRWILTKPIMVIDEEFYQVDPHCSIIAKELGSTSCGESQSTEAQLSNQNLPLGVSVIELSSIAGVGTMLVFVIILVILLVLCCVSKKTKSYDIRSLQQQKLDSTPSQVEFKSKDESNSVSSKGRNFKEVENPAYCEVPVTMNDMEYLDGTPSQDKFKSKDGSNRVSSKGGKDVIDKNPAYYEVPVTMNDMEETDNIYDELD